MIGQLKILLLASFLMVLPAPGLEAQVGGPGGCHLCTVYDFGPGQICDICLHHTFYGYRSCAQISCDYCQVEGYPCGVYAEVPEVLLENQRQLLDAMPRGFSVSVAGQWIDVVPDPLPSAEADGLSCSTIPFLEALLWASGTEFEPMTVGT